MIFLLLNIIFGSAFMLFIKWVDVRNREDAITVGCINYIVAAVMIAPLFFAQDQSTIDRTSFVLGAVMGGCYFIAYFFVIFAIKWIGATASTVIAVLSIMLPILCGVFLWGEEPNGWQVTGVILALGSLLLIGAQKSTADGETGEMVERPWFTPILLLLFFILCGLSRLAQGAVEYSTDSNQPMTFSFGAFALAAIPSAIVLIARGKKISRSEFLIGTAMGATNFLQTLFILESLKRYETYIVFPIVSAGGIILTALVATLTMHERLSRKTWIGVSIATVALVLLKGME